MEEFEEIEGKEGDQGLRIEKSKVDLPLPAAFLRFLDENQINQEIYQLCGSLPRFIRVNPRVYSPPSETFFAEFTSPPESIPYLPGFYRLSGSTPVASTTLYKQGYIYGIDVSSGVAVAALDIRDGDNCLDLCAAPGAKFCMMADSCGPNGSVTGVDISQPRIAACKGLAKKYKLENVRLYLADGTKFDIKAPEKPSDPSTAFMINKKLFKRKKKQRKTQQLTADQPPMLIYQYPPHSTPSESILYDRVLVDAECTHDGSLKHILKYNQTGWENFEENFLNPKRLDSLTDLQRGLLDNGFRLLKNGGVLIYSTCSFSKKQNEEIINWFLEKEKGRAILEKIPENILPDRESCYSHFLPQTVRFDPVLHNTSGLFVAKFSKFDSPPSEEKAEEDNDREEEKKEESSEKNKKLKLDE